MKPTSRTALARQIAADIVDGACKDKGRWWSEQEAAHAAAKTPAEASEAAAEAMELCASCTETERCAILAELDRYTGLAAGAAYAGGVRRPIAATPRDEEVSRLNVEAIRRPERSSRTSYRDRPSPPARAVS
jgi:hypothetical protein